jgi:NitT/TauT family transport system substrate-binding protein
MTQSLLARLLATGMATACLAGVAQAEPIVLGTTPNLQTAPIVVALSEGFFADHGVEIQLVNFTSGRAALEAVLGGQLDMAFMAEYPVAVAALSDQKFAVVAALSRYTANRVISKGSVGFETIADLEGKRIGTTQGSNAAFFTELVLQTNGVTAEIVNVAPPDIVPALARGDIDAGVMFPDFYPAAQQALGEDYREFVSTDYTAHFVVCASADMIETRPQDIENFVAALVDAEAFIADNAEAAQAILAKAAQGALSQEAIAIAWTEAEYEIVLDQALVDLLLAESEWVVGSGLVSATPSPELLRSYIYTDALAAIDPARVRLD